MAKLRWGILSTGKIARRFASLLPESSTGILQAVSSRDLARAQAFAQEFHAPAAYGSHDDLLDDPAVDAVYIATPHPMHTEWAILAARKGKHILCEKPVAMTAAETEAILAAVREHDVFFMEAFLYRCHPQTTAFLDLIREGTIGQVTTIQCSFGVSFDYAPEDRLFARALGGGAILDLGCYAMSMTRLLAGTAIGQPFAEPLSLKALSFLDPQERTDLATSAVATFPGEILAHLHVGFRQRYENIARVSGTQGTLTLTRPFAAGTPGSRILLHDPAMELVREIDTEDPRPIFAYEIDAVGHHIADRVPPHPCMGWEDSLGNMRALDRWRAEAGVFYDCDQTGENALRGIPIG